MPSQSDLLEVVGEIYDAAADPGLWNRVLERITTIHKAGAAVLEVRQAATDRTAIAAVTNLDQGVTSKYEQEYAEQNILINRGAQLLTEGAALTEEMVCSTGEFLRSPYYNEYLREVDVRYLLGGVVLANQTSRAILALMRPHGMSRFTEAERETLLQLLPHLQRALRLHFQLSELRVATSDMTSTLHTLPYGVAFVEVGGKVSYTNAAAERVFLANDGLTLRASELVIADPVASSTYRKLRIEASRTAASLSADCPGGAVIVSRPSGRRSYWLSIYPSRSGALIRPWAPRPGLIVFINDPDAGYVPPLEMFGRAFRLTPSELRMVSAVLQSSTVGEAAEKLGVSRNTAHTHLNAVYQKTGIRTQSELARMVFAAPGRPFDADLSAGTTTGPRG